MKQIVVKVTGAPRAGYTILLVECSACGPVAVDSTGVEATVLGEMHLFTAHGISNITVRQ